MIADPVPTLEDPFADRRRWTRDECRRMEGAGLLFPGTYELLEGVIVMRGGDHPSYDPVSNKIYTALQTIFGSECVFVFALLPLGERNCPEPAIMITKQPATSYAVRGYPLPKDIRLVVELSRLAAWRNHDTKKRLYAQAEIIEYWVVEPDAKRVLAYRHPANGDYDPPLEFGEADSVSPLATPRTFLPVSDLLP